MEDEAIHGISRMVRINSLHHHFLVNERLLDVDAGLRFCVAGWKQYAEAASAKVQQIDGPKETAS
jgi:hypothetical protein